jgi:DNA uptake protein ComE-like DNA-binding protein
MKQYLSVAFLATLLAPLSLFAADAKVEEDLKSVMLHLDKTQKESAQKIEDLSEEILKLEKRNRDLGIMNKDLSSANIQLLKQMNELKTQVASLQADNKVLQEKMSDVPVKEVQTASLSSTPVIQPKIPAPSQSQRITPATLEQKSKAKQQPRFGPSFGDAQPKTQEPLTVSTDSDAEPIPDFSLSGARNNRPFDHSEPLSDGTILLVDINKANERELRLVPGLGPALATKIINNRPYASIWELMKIEGLGRNRVNTLAPYITTED